MKRRFKAAMLALALGLCSCFALSACSAGGKPAPDPDAGLRRQVMHASWAKGYASVEELFSTRTTPVTSINPAKSVSAISSSTEA